MWSSETWRRGICSMTSKNNYWGKNIMKTWIKTKGYIPFSLQICGSLWQKMSPLTKRPNRGVWAIKEGLKYSSCPEFQEVLLSEGWALLGWAKPAQPGHPTFTKVQSTSISPACPWTGVNSHLDITQRKYIQVSKLKATLIMVNWTKRSVMTSMENYEKKKK